MSTLEVNKITPQGTGTTVTLGDSGDSIDITSGATVTNFKSTGIDDNATSTAITIDNSENIGIGTTSPDGSSFSGSSSPVLDVSGTRPLIILSETDSNTKKAWLGLSSDQFFVGGTNTDTLFYTNGGERMRIESNGDIFFKNTTESAINGGSTDGKFIDNADGCRLRSSRASTSTREHIIFYNPNGDVGDISTSGTSTSYNTSSDYRLKENVIDLADATTRVKQLQPKRFNFIADADTTVDGFLAHEVSDIVPEAITGTKDEVDADGNPKYQGIDQSKLVPLLTASLQEAIAKIETLESTVSDLTTRLEALENA